MTKAGNSLTRRITAGLGIAAVAAAALLGSMAPANAAETAPSTANINSGTAKSLTIHKYAQPTTTGTKNTGVELPADQTKGLEPLNGVTFKIQEVTSIDLSTNEGWAATVGLTPADVTGKLADTATGQTNAAGVLTFTGLKQAVYLVTETAPGLNNIAFTAAPFLVTLPLPNASDSSWIYDVHVYPKNSLAAVSKTVDDSAATGLGSAVSWNITAKVPNKSEGNALQSFVVSDTLDSRLSYKSSTVTLKSKTALTLNTDYTVDTTTIPGTVRYIFTDTGMKKFSADEAVQITLVTTVTTLGGVNGVINNAATVYINDKNFTSDPATTKWGNVIIHKSAVNTNKTGSLKGAEFKVYATEADAKADANAIAVSGVSTFTSGNDGLVNIAGLRATANGGETALTYWLVETKAPAGYNIADGVSKKNPKSFTVGVGVISTAINIEVEDPQTPPFTLPLTGGPGTAAFMIVGLGLVSIAGGVALRKRSSRRAAQA